MKSVIILGCLSLLTIVSCQKQQQYTTPVPILKQINKHNEDGSYSYGYEAADGTFKIETKYPDGEVYGKYGYVDDSGKVREVEYGASRRGFEPAGNDINVAPPTLKSSNQYQAPLRPGEEDDGQYREDPAVYYKDEAYNQPAYQQQQQPQPQPVSRYQQQTYRQPDPEPVYQRPQPSFRPQQSASFDFDNFRSSLGLNKQQEYRPQAQEYRPQPQEYRPQPQPQVQYRPQPTPAPVYNNYQPTYQQPQQGYSNYNPGYRNNWWTPSNNYNSYSQYRQPIAHEPLPYNVDLNTGSYSLNVGRR